MLPQKSFTQRGPFNQNSDYGPVATSESSKNLSTNRFKSGVTPSVTIAITNGTNPDCAGDPITFTATPVDGGDNPVYQWKLNGNEVGTNADSYTVITPFNNDVVSCVMTSSLAEADPATVESNSITIQSAFSPDLTLLYINEFSVPAFATELSVCAGATVNFLASVNNGGNDFHYQWKLNGANVGTDNAAYSQTGFAANDVIRCEVTSNDACASPAMVGQEMTILIYDVSAATLLIDGESETCQGSTAYFSVNISNAGFAPSFQWKKNGIDVGTNDYSYSDNTLITGDIISCTMMTDPACGAQVTIESSNSINMSVSDPLVPSITISASYPLSSSQNLFSASVLNEGPSPIYNWQKNSNPVGGNFNTYTDLALLPGDVISCTLVSSILCVTTPTVNSNDLTVTSIQYCIPTPTGDPVCGTAWIGNVQLGTTIDRTSGCTGGYSDYTSTDTLKAAFNATINYRISEGSTTSAEFVNIYIDYNNDGDFNDAGESVVDGAYMDNGGFNAEGSFTIPTSVGPGTYRIRIVSDITDNSPATPNACETQFGEAEDYVLEITQPTYCIPVISQPCEMWISNVTIADMSNSSVMPGNCASGGYSDYSGLLSATVEPGQAVDYSLAANGNNYQYADIYVDYNADGDFNDLNEHVATNIFLDYSGVATTGSFTIPALQAYGQYRLRVKSHYSENAATGACGDDVTGETEDYRLIISCISNGADIAVLGNDINIEDGDNSPDVSDFTDFGSVVDFTVTSRTFTIQNVGTGVLTIAGITFSGAGASSYTVITAPAATVPPGESTTFTVEFAPLASETYDAVMHINNNNCPEADYDIAITGLGLCPAGQEINLQGNGFDIENADFSPATEDNTDFGTMVGNTSASKTFTIQNTGIGNLLISGIQLLNFDNLLQFSVDVPPASVIPPGGTSEFSISFNPIGSGPRNATVRITSNDCDESAYEFLIIGNADCPEIYPEINIKGNGIDITDADDTPDTGDNTDFGVALNGPVSKTFVIENTGTTALSISGIVFTGSDAANYSVISGPDAVVAPGNNTSFTVQMSATTSGIKSTVMHVINNDCDETDYDVALQATSTITSITLNLKMFLQGYYTGNGTMQPVLLNQGIAAQPNETDTVLVELHDASNFNIVDAKQAVLLTDGTVNLTFDQPDGFYYVAIQHRNSIKTWSGELVECTLASPLYDFSSEIGKAYGSNMIQVDSNVWAFFTGDINQDDFIDVFDYSQYNDDNLAGVNTQYVATDINGDGFVDVFDYQIYNDNNIRGASSQHP